MRVPPAPALSTSRAGRSATAIFSAPSWYSRTTVDPTGRSRYGRLSLTRTIAVLLLLPFLLAATGLAAEHEALVDEPPALKGSRSAAEHVERARALIGRGEPAAAVPLLREALRLDPSLTDARSSLGFALLGIGDVDGGIEELRAVLRRDPDAVAARVHLATALMARQDWTAARAELDHVLRREPGHLHAQYALGVVRYTLGDLAGAIDAYREVLAAAPEHHDARFNLALTLKLAHRDAEATEAFRVAAEAGVPRAQYFLATAYAGGVGAERDLAAAVTWWFRAADGGVTQADEALAQLRRVAVGRGRYAVPERRAAEDAFRSFLTGLWREFPDIAPEADETVGGALIAQGRAAEAVPVLLREAAALSEPAQRRLVELYEHGAPGQPPYDPRILAWLHAAAAEAQALPRVWLARIYAGGLGVAKDMPRAISLLRGTPHEEAQRLLQELSTAPQN